MSVDRLAADRAKDSVLNLIHQAQRHLLEAADRVRMGDLIAIDGIAQDLNRAAGMIDSAMVRYPTLRAAVAAVEEAENAETAAAVARLGREPAPVVLGPGGAYDRPLSLSSSLNRAVDVTA